MFARRSLSLPRAKLRSASSMVLTRSPNPPCASSARSQRTAILRSFIPSRCSLRHRPSPRRASSWNFFFRRKPRLPSRRRVFRLKASLGKKESIMRKISARNQLVGRVVDVHKGQTTAHVKVDIGSGVIVTASITNEAVDDLQIAADDKVVAIIKASDVMIGK